MRRVENAETAAEAVWGNLKLLAAVLHISRKTIYLGSIEEALTMAKTLHIIMQEIVLPEFGQLAEDAPPLEKSVFDEYDAAMDAAEGWEDEDADKWLAIQNNLDALTRLAIRVFRSSYADVQKEPLMALIRYTAYEIKQKEAE